MLELLAFVGGYVASIYSWSWLRTTYTGSATEVEALIAKIEALVPGSKVSVAPVPPVPPVAPVTTKSS